MDDHLRLVLFTIGIYFTKKAIDAHVELSKNLKPIRQLAGFKIDEIVEANKIMTEALQGRHSDNRKHEQDKQVLRNQIASLANDNMKLLHQNSAMDNKQREVSARNQELSDLLETCRERNVELANENKDLREELKSYKTT